MGPSVTTMVHLRRGPSPARDWMWVSALTTEARASLRLASKRAIERGSEPALSAVNNTHSRLYSHGRVHSIAARPIPYAVRDQATTSLRPTSSASRFKTSSVAQSSNGGAIMEAEGVPPPIGVNDVPPTRAQLQTLFMHAAVPMVGFGIMDNFVMLTAGDLIDNTLGVKFGLATLTAAACGQVVSDVCGVCFGGTVEAFATKLGLKPPDLSLHQRGLKISRLVATSGAAVGVVVGCLLGMLTLLCMDTTSADREKKQRDMDILLASILDNGRNLVEAERCSIFFVDEERGELWTKVATDRHGAIKTGKMITIPITAGVVGEVVRTKATKNVADTSKDSNYFKGVDQVMKTETRTLLAVPVISSGKDRGKVIAVIEMMNKPEPFDEMDEKLVGMLAAHMSAFMKQLAEGSSNDYETAQPMKPL